GGHPVAAQLGHGHRSERHGEDDRRARDRGTGGATAPSGRPPGVGDRDHAEGPAHPRPGQGLGHAGRGRGPGRTQRRRSPPAADASPQGARVGATSAGVELRLDPRRREIGRRALADLSGRQASVQRRLSRSPCHPPPLRRTDMKRAFTATCLAAAAVALPVAVAQGATAPNDALYGRQWALPTIHAPDAWARTMGSPDIKVAVVDSGVTMSQPTWRPAARRAAGKRATGSTTTTTASWTTGA